MKKLLIGIMMLTSFVVVPHTTFASTSTSDVLSKIEQAIKEIRLQLTSATVLSTTQTAETITTTITSSSTSFAFNFPKEGDVLLKGKTYKLKWTGSDKDVNSYTVYLVGGQFGDTGSRALGTAFSSLKKFSFIVPTDLVNGDNYQIQFSGKGATGGNTSSFTITDVANATPSIIVTQPTQHEGKIYAGATTTVNILTKNIPLGHTLDLYLYNPERGDISDYTSHITLNSATTSYSFFLGTDVPAGKYFVNVCDEALSHPKAPGKPLCSHNELFTVTASKTISPLTVSSVHNGEYYIGSDAKRYDLYTLQAQKPIGTTTDDLTWRIMIECKNTSVYALAEPSSLCNNKPYDIKYNMFGNTGIKIPLAAYRPNAEAAYLKIKVQLFKEKAIERNLLNETDYQIALPLG